MLNHHHSSLTTSIVEITGSSPKPPLSKNCLLCLVFRFILVTMQESESFTLDTHAIVKEMMAAGVPEQHAEAYVGAMVRFHRFNLATKADVTELQREIAQIRRETENLRKETNANIENLRKETKTGIESLRKETKIEMENIRKDIELLKRDLTIRMGGIMAIGVGLIIAIFGLS